MIFSVYRDTAADALEQQRRSRWRRRASFGDAGSGVASMVGGAAAVGEEEFFHPKHRIAILVGVTTGVSVWLATKILDRLFK